MPGLTFNNILTQLTTLWTAASCLCNPHQIKLYWEDGYNWQERRDEFAQFCMMHSYRGFPGYGVCFYGSDVGFCQQDSVYLARCTSDPRQKWVFLPMEESDSSQFQIQAVSTGLCLERLYGAIDLRMRECNSTIANQFFFTPSATTSDYRFAISQGTTNLCLGQDHHPKNGEIVEMSDCRKADRDDTLFWETGDFGSVSWQGLLGNGQ